MKLHRSVSVACVRYQSVAFEIVRYRSPEYGTLLLLDKLVLRVIGADRSQYMAIVV